MRTHTLEQTLYTLPELPYSPGALEPHYSGEIVALHHDKHHAAYVKGANDTLEAMVAAREAAAVHRQQDAALSQRWLGEHTQDYAVVGR